MDASASGMDSPEALPMTSSCRQSTESLAGLFASERLCFIFLYINAAFRRLFIFFERQLSVQPPCGGSGSWSDSQWLRESCGDILLHIGDSRKVKIVFLKIKQLFAFIYLSTRLYISL